MREEVRTEYRVIAIVFELQLRLKMSPPQNINLC